MSWCRYHTESPTFLGPVAEGRTTGPVGRHSCCGQQAFRYETVPGPNVCLNFELFNYEKLQICFI